MSTISQPGGPLPRRRRGGRTPAGGPEALLCLLAGSEDDQTPTRWWSWTEHPISTIRHFDQMVDLADAASVLREARRRAGLTQAELGRRAGVTQSVVSAYESGRRQPSLPVLLRLLRASGHVLDASLVAAEPAGLSGPLGRRVWQHRHRITAVAASHGVRRVRVFGSVARGTETPGSDVDLLVDLPEGTGLFALGPPAPRPGGDRGRPHRPGAGRRPPTGRALERRDRSGDPVSRHTRQRLLEVAAD